MRKPKAKSHPPQSPTAPSRPLQAWTIGDRLLTTSARGLADPSSSGASPLLLLVGLGLVVLVVGETTFLRLATREPEPGRAAEEPLPIRRVQLKR